MIKKIILLILIASYVKINAVSIPKVSSHDNRIQKQVYIFDDVIAIKASSGYLTSIIFAKDEVIEDAFTGFKDGWETIIRNNILYIKPIIPKIPDQLLNKLPANVELTGLTPNKKWNTNLLVRTNKRFYTFDLDVVAKEEQSKKSYVIEFSYPKEQAVKRDLLALQAKKQQEQRKIKQELNKAPLAKNWNYVARIKKNSISIAPSFAYDDGFNLYLGFTKNKSIPAVFRVEGKNEIIVNSTISNFNKKYKLLMVNNISPIIVLRKGNQAVGVFNKTFDQNIGIYQDTVSPAITRKIKE